MRECGLGGEGFCGGGALCADWRECTRRCRRRRLGFRVGRSFRERRAMFVVPLLGVGCFGALGVVLFVKWVSGG